MIESSSKKRRAGYFVITAYVSDRIQRFDKKEILWKKH